MIVVIKNNILLIICFFLIADFLSYIFSLNHEKPEAIFLFLYNIKNGADCILDDDKENADTITFKNIINVDHSNAKLLGYNVNMELYRLSRININIQLNDFGITIIMLFFAKYYSHGQYEYFIDEFKSIKELEILTRFLLNEQQHITLPVDLATHKKYSLSSQSYKFTKNNILTVKAFRAIVNLMTSKMLQYNIDDYIENFIMCIEDFHIHIIESFYMFTSVIKNCLIIKECHNLGYKNYAYTFPKPIKTSIYDGDYWFQIPNGANFFAYHNNMYIYSGYESYDTNLLLNKLFNRFNFPIVGIVYNHHVFPIIFDHTDYIGNWTLTKEYIQQCNFNCIFRNNNELNVNGKMKNVYFVKTNISGLFKLIYNK